MPIRAYRSHFVLAALLLASCRHQPKTTPAAAGGVKQPVPPVAIVDRRDAARVSQATAQAAFPGGWRFPVGVAPSAGEHAMVVSNSRLASEAGVEILRNGGNAVDAAVATGFALAVTYPSAGNIGGGGFMNIRLADGRSVALDYREVAPLTATRNMYIDTDGKLTRKSIEGYLASGVPGSVAGLSEALKKYGTMSLAQVMVPAIRLAEEGFAAESAFVRGLGGPDTGLVSRFGGKHLFFPGGKRLTIGANFKQPDLARTLKLIAAQGPMAFYSGEIGDSIVAEEKRGGGIITKADLARYKPEWRIPVKSTYRGYTLFTMPPASSGGITMTETLNILENFAPLPPMGSTQYVHLLAESYRRAFIDRNSKLADPAFAKVPIEELTSKAYAKKLAQQIDRTKATRTPAFNTRAEGEHTTHYSVVDKDGNAVATTTTLNGSFGSGVWVRGGGFFMNNEMDDFAAQPGTPNMFGLVQGEVNAIQPGKRMLSAMSPTIVLDQKNQVLLVTGAAGGPTIITATMEVILNVIEYHMTLADAMRAPRLHHQGLPDRIAFEGTGLTGAVTDSLKAMGHTMLSQNGLANVNSIMRVAGGWHGVYEPRSTGGAVGY